ncbi:MAG: hypothetical protein IJ995_06005 [Clostridia bacterium]|nr:hypothetical protein [Clostridia bacterium]
MKKKHQTPREELLDLRIRMENLETKLAMIDEPMLMDALAYELLALKSRMNFLISDAKKRQQVH